VPLIAGEILALVHLETGVSKDRKHIDSKRGIDAIQKANSGYSGLPMGEGGTNGLRSLVKMFKCES